MKHRIRNGRGGGALGGFTRAQRRIERFSILRIANLVNLAEARACKPSLLLMVVVA